MKASAADNFYICGTIRANLSGQGNYTTGYLAKVSWFSALNQLKLAFEEINFADPNGNYDYKGLALDATRTDVILLRDDYFSYSNHQQEIVSVVDYDVPSPLRLLPHSEAAGFQVSYSPAGNLIYVQAQEAVQSAMLCDITGRAVLTAAPQSDYFELNTSDIPRGVYVLRSQCDNQIITRKITVY
jgi:hypothetical protein